MINITCTRMATQIIRKIIGVNFYDIKSIIFGVHSIRVRLNDTKIKLISYQDYINYIKEHYNGKTFTL